jgi:hypothetical protein
MALPKFENIAGNTQLAYTNLLYKDPADTLVDAPDVPVVGDITEIIAVPDSIANGQFVQKEGAGLTTGDKFFLKRVNIGYNKKGKPAFHISGSSDELTIVGASVTGLSIKTSVPAGAFATSYLVKLPGMSTFKLLPYWGLFGIKDDHEFAIYSKYEDLITVPSEEELLSQTLYAFKKISLGNAEKTPEPKTTFTNTEVDMHNAVSLSWDDNAVESITGNFEQNSFEFKELMSGGNYIQGLGTQIIGGGSSYKRPSFFVEYALIRDNDTLNKGYYGKITDEDWMHLSENRTTTVTLTEQPFTGIKGFRPVPYFITPFKV